MLIGICDKVKIHSKNRLPDKYKQFAGKTSKIIDIKEGIYYLDIDGGKLQWRINMFTAI